MGSKKILIGGYGTLLLQESLNTSIQRNLVKETVEYFPMVVEGYRRLFNLKPTHYKSSSKISTTGIEMGAANVRKCAKSSFNGLCFYVDEEEALKIDQREVYYEKALVDFKDFKTNKSLGEGYIYTVNELTSDLLINDPKELMPNWRDIVYARTGAYRISEDFGDYYDQTTYLADGESLTVDNYRRLGVIEDDFFNLNL